MAIIQVDNLSFYYVAETEVLHEIDLYLSEQTTAIIGQNGAGKSTFARLLKGLLQPVQGNVFVNGLNIKEMTAAKLSKYIGMVFQHPNDQIFKNKVIDEVMFGPLNIGHQEEIARANAIAALKTVGLEDSLEKNPYDLSLSARKMIAIASILAMKTDIVIFDEPTIGQDHAGKEKIKGIIKQLRKDGKLVICILHDMDFVADVFERTIIFNEGRILLDGPTREVFSFEETLQTANLEQPYVTQVAKHFGLDQIFLTEAELIERISKNRHSL